MPVTKYVWDVTTDSYLMETDENDVTTAVYTNEPGQFGPVISQRRGGASHFFHRDGLGSVVDVTDAAEDPTDSYVYKGYGEIVAATGSTVNPFRWVGSLGYYHDPDLVQYYIRARHYDSTVGRFLSRDPIESDSNLYRYVGNDPTDAIDPSGLFIVVGPRGYARTASGSGFPRDSATGGIFRFYRQVGDLSYVIQDVEVTGTLLCETGEGYNVVGFRYSWTEVWPFSFERPVRDHHVNSPEGAARFVNQKCGRCPCDFRKPWWFTSRAEFVAYVGGVAPALHSSAVTPVDACTTYRCVYHEHEGTTVEGNDALMDMYPGKRAPDPAGRKTALSDRTLARGGTPGIDVDSWDCRGGPSYRCNYSSTTYAPPRSSSR